MPPESSSSAPSTTCARSTRARASWPRSSRAASPGRVSRSRRIGAASGSSIPGRRTWTTPPRVTTGDFAPPTTSGARSSSISSPTSGVATSGAEGGRRDPRSEGPMYGAAKQRLQAELDGIDAAGLAKGERLLESPQRAAVIVGGREVLNLCANNYLGLADDPRLIRAAQDGLGRWGFGMASVRFICGTQSIHRQLEAAIARFLGVEDAILYTSCFDANGGLFETLLDESDVVISDALNHASIIDGIRLCRAQRQRYAHADMTELERILTATRNARTRLIVTDGVFSMDGDVAPLGAICDLADRHGALIMVDDSHATGFFGPTGRGTPEHCGVAGRIDIITSTPGKALGGASGGFTASRREVVALLRQRSRPYLFSNSLPPTLVCAALACLEMLSETTTHRDRLAHNTPWFPPAMTPS